MSENETPRRKDVLLALYYEGGTATLFDPFDDAEPSETLDVELCEAVLAGAPEHVEALAYLGTVYTRRGEYQRGLDLDLRLARLRPRSARVHYNLACSYALLGRPDDAFESMDTAIECGFRDVEHLQKDEDLNSLHDDPRYETLLTRLRTLDADSVSE
jgi:tetratricopeptide (TPR) repeat protein